MGLFNYIRVEQELPLDATLKTLNRNWRDMEFQTKEIEENALFTYILRDNKLYEEVLEGHKRYDKFRDDYTGTFVFGCIVYGDTIDGMDFFPDWKAVVVNGEVKQLTIISEYNKFSSKDRIENEIKLDIKLAKHERKMRCPVYRIYFNYYVRSVERTGWAIQKYINKTIRALEWMNWKGIKFLVKILTPR